MNQLETSDDSVKVQSRPMFASTWITLYEELLKHYSERHVMIPVNFDNARAEEDDKRKTP